MKNDTQLWRMRWFLLIVISLCLLANLATEGGSSVILMIRGYDARKRILGGFADFSASTEAAPEAYSMALRLSTSERCFSWIIKMSEDPRGFTYPGNDVDRCGFSHWQARQFAAPLLFSGEA